MKLLSIDKPPVDVLKIIYLEKFKNKETGMINPFFPYYKDIINDKRDLCNSLKLNIV